LKKTPVLNADHAEQPRELAQFLDVTTSAEGAEKVALMASIAEIKRQTAEYERQLAPYRVTSLATLLLLEDSSKLKVTNTESDSSHTQNFHFHPTALTKAFELSEIDTTKLSITQSSLLCELKSVRGQRRAGTEAEVAGWVRKALSDAMQLLQINHAGLPELTLGMERSLFSNRLDLVVSKISEINNVPLFAIKVETSKEGLFDEPKVLD
jgi:hypothetical protein